MKRSILENMFFGKMKLITGFLILLAILISAHVGAKTVHAQEVPTDDFVIRFNTSLLPSFAEKELVLDGIATAAVKIIIDNMTSSIVTWINSGFEGNPAFISDPDAFFTDVGDQIAGNFIAGTELGFMCEPFSLDIRRALAINYGSNFVQRNYCRLSSIVSNTENFAKFTKGDFSQGGWDSWFSITQNAYNNPTGAQFIGETELTLRTARGEELAKLEANWGLGFLSSRDCIESDPDTQKCIKHGPIKTPGTVIESQLENTLGTGIRQYELAKDFDEIVNALVGQLVQTVFTKGLSSFGSGGSNYGSLRSNTADQLYVTCSPDRTTAAVGELVTWSAFVHGGAGDVTYSWSGDDLVDGATTESVYVGYSEPGRKSATVRINKGGQNLFQICSSQVDVHE